MVSPSHSHNFNDNANSPATTSSSPSAANGSGMHSTSTSTSTNTSNGNSTNASSSSSSDTINRLVQPSLSGVAHPYAGHHRPSLAPEPPDSEPRQPDLTNHSPSNHIHTTTSLPSPITAVPLAAATINLNTRSPAPSQAFDGPVLSHAPQQFHPTSPSANHARRLPTAPLKHANSSNSTTIGLHYRDYIGARIPGAEPRRAFTSPDLTGPSPSPAHVAMARNGDSGIRKSSLDSAMSSVSSNTSVAPSMLSNSTGHSHKSSETTVTSSPDAASLVAQAGGNPTLVIDKILKENKALSSRNEQLWRLVEKQRSMLHGLSADHERALKDKERYRKRLKEYQELVPAVPRTTSAAAASTETPNTDSLGDVISPDYFPPSVKLIAPRALPHQVLPSQDSQISSNAESITIPHARQQSLTPDIESDAPSTVSSNNPSQPPPSQQSPLTPKATIVKNVSSPGEKSRKLPPKPLDLSKPQSSSLPQPPDSQPSCSDYGDDEERAPIKVPEFARGRRRTREEDDKEREIVAMAEEARSRSEKSKKGKGKLKPGDDESALSISTSPTGASGEDTASPVDKAVGSEAAKIAAPAAYTNATPPTTMPPVQLSADSIDAMLAPAEKPSVTRHIPQSIQLPPKSPGLPMSPKPVDRPPGAPMPRAPVNGLASPGPGPLSSRQGLPLSPRAPKYPLPMPTTPSFQPGMRHDSQPTEESTSMAERLQSTHHANSNHKTSLDDPASMASAGVYRGFVTDQYPGLLLNPNALPLIIVKVWSSRLRPSTHSRSSRDEDLVFTLGVHLRSSGKQLWKVEKKPSILPMLDRALRQYVKIPAALPDRSIFAGHAPAKVDTRRAALNRYFEALLDTPMDDKTALIVCDYFSKDVVEPEEHADLTTADEPRSPTSPKTRGRKEGYLAKKGKQFGGWKSRYFILENSQLKHFESPAGQPLGIIKLANAQIAKPNARDLEEDAEFRHAFMILEPKRKDSSSLVRHVLCAESDEERDGWVETLLQHIMGPQTVVQSPPTSPRIEHKEPILSKAPPDQDRSHRMQRAQDSIDSQATRELHAVNYDDTIALDAPQLGTPGSAVLTAPSPLIDDQSSSSTNTSLQHPTISGPVAGGPIQNASMWGNKSLSPTRAKDKEAKKRSVFGFMSRNPDEPHSSHGMRRGLSPRPPVKEERRSPSRAIFGIPLAEAAEYSQPVGANICIPSPVYRCIEYLEAREAALEEGIFRLSGSSTIIRALKERFDNERDVNLLDGPYIDVHAVASLLKLYLRELPDTILTREKFVDFQQVLEVEDTKQRLAAINLLIHQLPEANREVLVALSRYLIQVVNNAEKNRMSLKNVGIVFAPTLNIPTPLVNLCITDFDAVFTTAPTDPDTASPVLENIAAFKAENPSPHSPRLPPHPPMDFDSNSNQSQGGYGLEGSGLGVQAVQMPYQRFQEQQQQQHSPKTSQNSFTEHLAEQRQQLRRVADQRENGASSAASARANAMSAANRTHQSPSPASRGYKSNAPMSRHTPPPNGSQEALSFIPPSSTSSSPNSSSMKGRDSPGGENTGSSSSAMSGPMSRKAKRESAMLGNFDMSTAGLGNPNMARPKSSYNRLRENFGNNVLQEE